jgi:uncharacterized protein YjiK
MLLPLLLLALMPPDSLPYDLNEPALVVKLADKELAEVSGLSATDQPGVLCVIADERGEAFFLDTENGGRITDRLMLREKGDFEGVEWIGHCVFALRSDGRLYEMGARAGESDGRPRAKEFKTRLNEAEDFEGLGYDPGRKRLLLVGKGDRESAEPRHIYAFDLKKHAVADQPAYTIHPNQVNDLVAYDSTEKREFFSPSGLAVHPTTGEIYVISTALKRLIVLDGATGALVAGVRLDKKMFPQPEGITFDSDGRLWISCEAKDDKPARLLRFDPR